MQLWLQLIMTLKYLVTVVDLEGADWVKIHPCVPHLEMLDNTKLLNLYHN